MTVNHSYEQKIITPDELKENIDFHNTIPKPQPEPAPPIATSDEK